MCLYTIQSFLMFLCKFHTKGWKKSFFFKHLKIPGPWSSLSGGGEPEELCSGGLFCTKICFVKSFFVPNYGPKITVGKNMPDYTLDDDCSRHVIDPHSLSGLSVS